VPGAAQEHHSGGQFPDCHQSDAALVV
jgi:hypothetical protein